MESNTVSPSGSDPSHPCVTNGKNYLELTEADRSSVKPEDMSSYVSFENVLQNYKSIDCVCCNTPFGFQHRKDPNIKVCNSRCLAIIDRKIKSQGHLKMGSLPLSPSPNASRVGLNSFCGVTMPIVISSSTDRSAPVVTSEPKTVNGESGVGDVPSYGANNRAAPGYSSVSGRGGRGGGFSGGRGGLTRPVQGTERCAPTTLSSEAQKYCTKVQRSMDETDAKLAPTPSSSEAAIETTSQNTAKVTGNDVPSSSDDAASKSLKISRKEDVIRAAREGAKLTKPGRGRPVLSSATTTDTKAAPLEKQLLSNSTASSMPVSFAPKKTESAVPSPVPLMKVNVTAPAKKIWTIFDLDLSPSFEKEAACKVAFMWGLSKFTINAVQDETKLEKLQKDISESSTAAQRVKRVPAVNDIVIAPYQEDLYRARVDKVDEKKGEVFVVFIDYGDSEAVKLNECYDPTDKVMEHNPIYGFIFSLELNASLSSKCKVKLNEEIQAIIEESTVYLQKNPRRESDVKWLGTGTLFIGVERKKSLNSIIEKFIEGNDPPAGAVTSSCPAVVPPTEVKSEQAPPVPVNGVNAETKKPADVAAPASTPTTSTSTSTSTQSRPERVNPFSRAKKQLSTRKTIHNSSVSTCLTDGATVQINFVWNNGMLTISAVDDNANLASLDELIAKHVKTAPGMVRKPDVDEIVIAPYEGSYYRGRVTGVNGDLLQITFVDYGDKTEVSPSECKELSSEINDKHPIYGVIFHLAGVPETKSKTENNAELSAALESQGQMQVVKTEKTAIGELTGRIWFGNDRNLNNIVVGNIIL